MLTFTNAIGDALRVLSEIERTKATTNQETQATTESQASQSLEESPAEYCAMNESPTTQTGLEGFNKSLEQHQFWYILTKETNSTSKKPLVYDSKSKTILQEHQIQQLNSFLNNNPFLYIKDKNEKIVATLQSKKRMLWSNELSKEEHDRDGATTLLKTLKIAGIDDWQLPTTEELKSFATEANNPFRSGQEYRLKTISNGTTYKWLTTDGSFDVDANYLSHSADKHGRIFACNTTWADKQSTTSILLHLIENEYLLVATDKDYSFNPLMPIPNNKNSTHCKTLISYLEGNVYFQAVNNDTLLIDPQEVLPFIMYTNLDYTPCRLPKLTSTQLTDPEKGLWELWGEDPTTLKQKNLVARNPLLDLKNNSVAIDFGTSSTVVAMSTDTGSSELLRIGVRDFFQIIRAQDFENPTVLECVDYQAFYQAWTNTTYRPALNWDWMRASHEAREHFRDNPGDPKVLSSTLPLLKQWALCTTEQERRLTDQQQPPTDIKLAPHTERNPMRGQALQVTSNDPFDPIELYAWFLGMNINYRERGLFIKYYLSFPVKYPKEVKARILASFRRGLQRSLPVTLIEQHPQVLNDFEVTELASEPAAYAAAAMPHLGIEPTEEGVPYAVFDFGGGTSDFDYGVLRWATPEEESLGYERVFEQVGNSGDNFLGGENLLAHLVYESFKQNLDLLRELRIQFTKPQDAKPFPGSEGFISNSLSAQTNSIRLAAELRSFMECDEADLKSVIKVDLLDSNGNKQACELAFNDIELDVVLANRIHAGVSAFLSGLASHCSKLPANQAIHVLLSGNGSRSRHIREFFDTSSEEWSKLLNVVFGDQIIPELIVHQPLPMNDTTPFTPTAKTGVALGLLRLAPGENTLLKNHLHDNNEGEAPFTWYAGRMYRGLFQAGIAPEAKYGEWHQLGPLQQGIFNLYTTNSPRANTLKDGATELRKHRLSFSDAPLGARLFARASKPNVLEIAAAINPQDLEVEGLRIQTLELK